MSEKGENLLAKIDNKLEARFYKKMEKKDAKDIKKMEKKDAKVVKKTLKAMKGKNLGMKPASSVVTKPNTPYYEKNSGY